MAVKIYYQEDCNMALLEGKTVAVIGYGSQESCSCIEFKGIRSKRSCWSV